MSDVVEKQDVDIAKLFDWGRVYEIVDPSGKTDEIVSVYMKLLGDADLGRARTYALRRSAELRRKLRDENSDERVAWVRPFDEVEHKDLVNLIILFSGRQLSNNAKQNVKVPTPKQPKSNASLKKLEEFQKEVDEYPKKKAEAIRQALEKEITKLTNELNTRSKDELYKQYVRELVDEFCEKEAMNAFEDMATYLGCYKDNSYKADKRFFKDFEEFENLDPAIKIQFKDAYRSLDLELPELKKLRRATP